ncbi:MAG TPA: cation transporter [Drouetiella sp.]
MTRKLTKECGGVKHHLPHRTRIKVPNDHRDPGKMDAVKNQLQALPGVQAVEVNHRTGSVVVHHDERSDTLELMGTAIESICDELFEEILAVEEIEFPGLSVVAQVIRNFLSKADIKVAEGTQNVVDLKMIVPLLFFGAGVVKSRQTGNWWGEVPAWVLFYYAYDSYMKFHGVGFAETLPLREGDLENGDTVVATTTMPRRITRRSNGK